MVASAFLLLHKSIHLVIFSLFTISLRLDYCSLFFFFHFYWNNSTLFPPSSPARSIGRWSNCTSSSSSTRATIACWHHTTRRWQKVDRSLWAAREVVWSRHFVKLMIELLVNLYFSLLMLSAHDLKLVIKATSSRVSRSRNWKWEKRRRVVDGLRMFMHMWAPPCWRSNGRVIMNINFASPPNKISIQDEEVMDWSR